MPGPTPGEYTVAVVRWNCSPTSSRSKGRHMACPLVEVFGGWCGVAARSLVPLLACRQVPQRDHPFSEVEGKLDLAPRRGQRLAVRTVRHRQHNGRGPLEGGLLLACLHVPERDRQVLVGRGQRLAVRAVGHGVHLARVSLEGGSFL